NGLTPGEFMSTADRKVIFEGPQSNSDPNGASFDKYPNQGPYQGLGPPFWWTSFPSSRIVNLVHSAPESDLTADINKVIQLNAGSVFITDKTLPNPYDQLPSYWNQEVAAIRSVHEPSS